MRWLIPLLVVFGCAKSEPPPPLDQERKGTIVAKVEGLRSDKGRLLVRLYHGEEGFPSDAEVVHREVTFAIRDGKATIRMENVPYGEYALWVCHDENEDGELETNFIGMPKEGVGVSGPPPSFIPKYAEAKFDVDRELVELTIPMKYL